MQSLKNFAILETFRGLEEEEQRTLLHQLWKETKNAPITIDLEDSNKQIFYNFMLKKWAKMSMDFFNESWRRWNILKEKSYGDKNLSTADVGDLYLTAKKVPDLFYMTPFGEEKEDVFNIKIPSECSWRYMFIWKFNKEDEPHVESYLISDLFELSREDFENKMKEYGFL